MVVIEHIDHPGEAPRRIGIVRGQLRYVRHEHRGEAVRDLQVIGLRMRAAAQLGEIEPHHVVRDSFHRDQPAEDRNMQFITQRIAGDLVEQCRHARLVRRIGRRIV